MMESMLVTVLVVPFHRVKIVIKSIRFGLFVISSDVVTLLLLLLLVMIENQCQAAQDQMAGS